LSGEHHPGREVIIKMEKQLPMGILGSLGRDDIW
jgi:hypothetical protein